MRAHLPVSVAPSVTSTVARIVLAARQFISPTIFRDDPYSSTIIVPVRDDRFAPVLRCGEFAVVDQQEDWPEPDHCYWLRFAKGRDGASVGAFAFVGEASEPELDGKSVGPHYRVNYGLANVRTVDGQALAGFAGVCMGDSIPAAHLRVLIVGRVLGVLGDSGRAMNWRDSGK